MKLAVATNYEIPAIARRARNHACQKVLIESLHRTKNRGGEESLSSANASVSPVVDIFQKARSFYRLINDSAVIYAHAAVAKFTLAPAGL